MSSFDFTNQDGSGDMGDLNNWTQDGVWPASNLPAAGDTATNSTSQAVATGTFNGDTFDNNGGGNISAATFNSAFIDRGNSSYNNVIFNGFVYSISTTSGPSNYGNCDFTRPVILLSMSNTPSFTDMNSISTYGTERVAPPGDVLGTAQNLGIPGTYLGASGMVPAAADVRYGVAVGGGIGSCYVPGAADVRQGVNVDATTGTCYVPTAAEVLYGVNVDATSGSVVLPTAGQVENGVSFGPASTVVGRYDPLAAAVFPAASQVLVAIAYGPTGADYTGTMNAGGGGLTTDEHDALFAIQAKTENLPANPAAALSSADYDAIADAVLSRGVAGVEASADEHSLCFVVLALSESNTTANANMLTVFRSDGTTEFVQKAITSSATTEAITGVS
jgi:hypothetical protein